VSPDCIDKKRGNRKEEDCALQKRGKWLKHYSYSIMDIPRILYGDEKGHNTPEKWAIFQAKRLNDNYCNIECNAYAFKAKAIGNTVLIFRTPEQLLYHRILEGSIRNDANQKISENQFYSKKPKLLDFFGKNKYYLGLIVKITADYDKELLEYNNCFALIFDILDNYHYRVLVSGKYKIVIRDTDINNWICDEFQKFSQISEFDWNELRKWYSLLKL
jgi:hypothetical protein